MKAALVGFFASSYSLYGLLRHWNFGSGAFDLGIFDQLVWRLSRFEVPASSVRGLSNMFGDHFNPIVVLLAPLYWVAPAAETLIVTQGMLFALSIVPVFVFLRSRLPQGAAVALATSYGLFWGLQRAAAFDFHDYAFAPLLIAIAILAADRRRWTLFWITAVAIALIKEDLIPLLTIFGMLLYVQNERRRGATLVVASLAAYFLVTAVLIPALSDSGEFVYASSYREALSHPWLVPLQLITPAVKLRTAVYWLAPFAFLSLFSPLTVLLVPFVLSRFLSEAPNHWSAQFHYSAPLAPILAMSAGDGLARIAARVDSATARTRFVVVTTGVCVVLSAILPGNQPLWDLFKARHYERTAVERAGEKALALVPESASVVAQGSIVPHLSQRARIYVLDDIERDVEYVVASRTLGTWPLADAAALDAAVRAHQARGYTTVFEEAGWTVLRRP